MDKLKSFFGSIFVNDKAAFEMQTLKFFMLDRALKESFPHIFDFVHLTNPEVSLIISNDASEHTE